MRSLSHHCLMSSELDAQLVSVDLMPRSVPLDRENTLLLKRHCSSVDSLPHDVVELILERLPVESLLRFKTVSTKWKSTIESRRFQERQLIRRMQTRGEDVLCVSRKDYFNDGLDTEARTIMFGSSIFSTVRPPTLRDVICHGSCDGLVCLYDIFSSTSMNVVVNPATRWHQYFPLSNFQRLHIEKEAGGYLPFLIGCLGFGKDNIRGMYKTVWLHNSHGFGPDNVTTCEVYDFSTNAWRYILPASPYEILKYHDPVYLDGSLYWFTKCEETKVLSFDLHTETFQVISKTPFTPHLSVSKFFRVDPNDINMCILNNRLSVSEIHWPTQVIWSYDSLGGNKKWEKMCSIDLTEIFPWFGERLPAFPLLPIAILDKNKLLLQGHDYFRTVVLHDLHTKSIELLFKPTKPVAAVYYFQSLLSDVGN